MMPLWPPAASFGHQSLSNTKFWIVHAILAGVAIAAALGARAYLGKSKKFRSRVVGIIPACFVSSRFHGKPLAEILGKPMIQLTMKLLGTERCTEALKKWRRSMILLSISKGTNLFLNLR